MFNPNIIDSVTLPWYEMIHLDFLFRLLSAFGLRYLLMDEAPLLASVTLKQNCFWYTQTELILFQPNIVDSVLVPRYERIHFDILFHCLFVFGLRYLHYMNPCVSSKHWKAYNAIERRLETKKPWYKLRIVSCRLCGQFKIKSLTGVWIASSRMHAWWLHLRDLVLQYLCPSIQISHFLSISHHVN